MTQSNHFGVIEVAPLSSSKSTGVDDGRNQLMQALCDRAALLVSTTSPFLVAASVYNRAFELSLDNHGTPPVANFTVQFAKRTAPALHRGPVKIINNTSFIATLEVADQSAAKPTLGASQTGYYEIYSDELVENSSGGGGGSTIATEDEGSSVDTTADTINFVGAGVTASDAGGGKTDVTIPGGGSFSGAKVKYASDAIAQDLTGGAYTLDFDAETYDVGGWHDNATNNDRVTVITGVTRVDITCNLRLDLATEVEYLRLSLAKNGSIFVTNSIDIDSASPGIGITALGVDVVATDFITAIVEVETNTSVTITAAETELTVVVAETAATLPQRTTVAMTGSSVTHNIAAGCTRLEFHSGPIVTATAAARVVAALSTAASGMQHNANDDPTKLTAFSTHYAVNSAAADGNKFFGVCSIFDPRNASVKTRGRSDAWNDAGTLGHTQRVFMADSAADDSTLIFTPNSGNFTSGDVFITEFFD